jgi:hypothetical protein
MVALAAPFTISRAEEPGRAAAFHVIVLAQMSSQQAQCQQEQAQLSQRLSQCSNDACRQQIQAAIAAHNAQCR